MHDAFGHTTRHIEWVEDSYMKMEFHDKHVPEIVTGEKTMTVRYDLDDGIQRGTTIGMQMPNDDTPFAFAPVKDVSPTTPFLMAEAKWPGHRNYDNIGEVLHELDEYYPMAYISQDTVLDVVSWGEVSAAEWFKKPLFDGEVPSYDWTVESVDEAPGYGSQNVAAYMCTECGAVSPKSFSSRVEEPIQFLSPGWCPEMWGGCDSATFQKLVETVRWEN